MKSLNVTESKAPITDAQLKRIVSDLGITIPESYRNFILLHNGGHPEKCAFEYSDNAGRTRDSVVNRFLSFGRGGGSDFAEFVRTYKLAQPPRISSDLIPIANDPFGNLVCLSVQGDRAGQVFFWDHEDEDVPNRGNEYRVSKSFDVFVDSLGPLPEVEDTEIPPHILKELEDED